MKRFYIFATATMLIIGASGSLTLNAANDSAADPVRRDAVSDLEGPMKKFRTSVPQSRQLQAESAPLGRFALTGRSAEAPTFYLTVPFMHTLGKNQPENENYLVVDANDDGKTWKLGGFSGYTPILTPAAGFDANDDWLISPPIELEAGEKYEMYYQAERATTTAGKTERLEVKMGDAQTVEAMTRMVVEPYDITQRNLPVVKNIITVDSDGYYCFGFHAIGEAGKCASLKLFNFGVQKAGQTVDPPAEGKLSYTLDPNGELKATVKYVAPTKSVSGAELASISKVEFKINYELVKTEENVVPGSTIEFEATLWHGANNKIEAIPYVDGTAGTPSSITGFYAGLDNPAIPTNCRAALSADGKSVTVSWDAVPAVGENGGYVPTDRVVYYIFDAFGSYYDPAIATTDKTSFTLDYSSATDQDFVAYQITAGVDEYYYSLAGSTNIVTVGEPYTLPWSESFGNCYFEQSWCIDEESDNEFMTSLFPDNYLQLNADDETADPVFLNSQDGDNGFLLILPTAPDVKLGFFAGKVSLKNASDPVLEFYYQGQGNVLDVLVTTDGNKFEAVKTIDLKANPTIDWTMCSISLKEYAAAPFVQFKLRLTARDNVDNGTEAQTWSVPIDNIRIRDNASADLKLVRISVAESIKAGNDAVVSAIVENIASTANTDATAQLYRDGEKIAEKALGEIKAFGFTAASFTDAVTLGSNDKLEYEIRIVSASDTNSANNSAKAEVAVEMPILPTVSRLSADNSGNGALIAWEAPDYSTLTQPRETVEDFENPEYEPLTIENFGEWTMIDADGLKTYTFLKDADNPFRTSPMAFQLYNPQTAGVPQNYLIDIVPNSGENLLVGWSAQGKNDNWLISPLLTGEAQTISFFAKSFTVAYAESFEVLYSTSGKDTTDFIKISDVENYPENGIVPEDWTEYKAALPDGAKYFAIRQTSDDTYALYIDDIAFKAAPICDGLELTGYNVYRDGKRINEAIVEGTSFVDNGKPSGTSEYRVSAVYNQGESRLCKGVSLTSDVDVLAASAVTISAGEGQIVISGAEGKRISIVNVAGVTVYAAEAASSTVKIDLVPGVYIVEAADTVVKVIVK